MFLQYKNEINNVTRHGVKGVSGMTGLVKMFLQYKNEINNVTRHGDKGVSGMTGLVNMFLQYKMKSTMLLVMAIKVLVQTTSLCRTNSCPLRYICCALNLSVSQAWPLNCVTNTRSTLLNCSP
jgi:hypothetical protein